MQKENDTLLVAKLREGNKFAFEALYEKYSARLYNTIVLLVYDKSLAKDITQSSFMTIWERSRGYRGRYDGYGRLHH